jgi:hypothetical protein
MATEAENEAAILRMGHPELVQLWGEIQAGDTPQWEPGRAFEYLVLRAFEIEGAVVRYPFSVRLQEETAEQIDGVVYAGPISALIESKDLGARVNVEPLAKLRNQLMRRPAATSGVVFSRQGFTEPAKALAQYMSPQTILLWHGDEVDRALPSRKMTVGLLLKYRYAVEKGLPDYHLVREGAL